MGSIMDSETPADAGELLAEAIGCHREGELTKAEGKYLELLKVNPKHPDALHLLGVIWHQMGSASEAIDRVNESLTVKPDQPIALNNLGNMLVAADRIDEAIECYQRSIEFDSESAQAHHNLGNVLGDVGRVEEAVDCYLRSLELRPDDIDSRLAMGVTLEKSGQFEESVAEYRKALAIEPSSIVSHSRLGAVLRKQNHLAEAKDVYDDWLRHAPGDPIATHLRAACDPKDAPDRASSTYVKATFDGFAEEFEERLAALNYRVPELFGEILQRHFSESSGGELCVGDLGCGTGLCASHLRGHAEQLVGVDLSPIMLERAGEKKLYDELIEADLIEHLVGCPAEYDLLVAADTLIYLGDLRSTFAAACGALREGGKLLVSVERLVDDSVELGYRLDRFGRYSHSEPALRRWLDEAGFDVQELTEAILRDEGNEVAVGCVVMAYKR